MLDLWNHWSLAVGDFVLGWSLRLPRDLTLAVVALATALLMIAVRRWTTPQDRLRRAVEDGRRLAQLGKQARRQGDKNALQRYKGTRALIRILQLKAEGLPFLVSLPPIALVAAWAVFRLEYLPVLPGEPVELAVYLPVSAAGEVIHIVPVDGVVAQGNWLRKVEAVTDDGPRHGRASWILEADGDPRPYTLTFRWKDRSFERQLIVGRRIYALPVVDHGDDVVSEWKREPFRWLGVVPGVPALAVPAWLIGYVVLVVPITLGLKRLLHVY
jgi:hypothetical protein